MVNVQKATLFSIHVKSECCHCRHVDSSEPYRASISHDIDSPAPDDTRFSRNVPLRRTVHTVPLSVYRTPASNQDDISPSSTPPRFRCAGSSSRSRGQPSFFGRLAAKFGRKRYVVYVHSSEHPRLSDCFCLI